MEKIRKAILKEVEKRVESIIHSVKEAKHFYIDELYPQYGDLSNRLNVVWIINSFLAINKLIEKYGLKEVPEELLNEAKNKVYDLLMEKKYYEAAAFFAKRLNL